MVALPASLFAWSFPFTLACPGQYSHRSFQRWLSNIDTCHSGLPIPLFEASILNLSDGGMCGLTVTSWGSPAEGMCDCFHLHCQDRIGCAVFMGGGLVVVPCLTVKPNPGWSLVTQLSVHTMSMRSRFAVLDICFACWPFSTLPSQVFWQECLWGAGIGLSTLPTPWFAWALCQLRYLQCSSTESSEGPTQDFPHSSLHLFVSFTASWSGLWWCSTAVKYTLTCSIFRLFCIGERSSMNRMVSVGVLSGSQYNSHCFVVNSDQHYQICLWHCCEA